MIDHDIVGGGSLTLEDEILTRIRPEGAEDVELQRAVKSILERAEELISEMGLDAEPILVGSMAKDTNLTGPDIDVFIRFDPKVPKDTMKEKVLSLGKRILEDPEKRYAEHPYLRGKFQGFNAEVVPCYRVEKASSKMSAVDRTPFHTNFIMENLEVGQRDQVRLLKGFLKGIGIYGAEIAVQGFSGYLCEILILKYGGFKELLKAASSWRRQVRIRLDAGKFPSFPTPMVFIDPVDPARNVASPVSEHSLSLLIQAARDYLERPSMEFFFPNPVEVLGQEDILARTMERHTEFVGIGFKIPEVVEDVYASQLTKAERAVSRLLDSGGFPVLKAMSFTIEVPRNGKEGKGLLVAEVGVRELSKVQLHKGPEVGHPNEGDFIRKWTDHPRKAGRPHIRDKHWVVYIDREFVRPSEMIQVRLEGLNLGKHLSQEVKKGFSIYNIEELAWNFGAQMSEFLDDRFPWER